MRRTLVVAASLALALAACGGERIIVGAGTTLVDSGFMTQLEQEYGQELSIVAGSTAELLELAARGAVDAVIVHDEDQEVAFMADHPSAERAAAFSSRFLLVGPEDLVGQLTGAGPAEVFAEIAANQWPFITRADGSGTHSRELAIWQAAGLDPAGDHYTAGDWYVATGQGMGLTLQVADQKGAFTLVEEGVFIGAAETIDLVEVRFVADLPNTYSMLSVDASGAEFFDWLTSAVGSAGIDAANRSVFDRVVYVPAR